jgi:opacity protein-like surface antigen/outer membrane protease
MGKSDVKCILMATTCLVALTVQGARAADIGAVAAPVAQAAPWSWAGSYAGLHLGGTFASGRGALAGQPDWAWFGADPAVPARYGSHSNGFLGGLQFGSNVQLGSWVIGVESDMSYTSLTAKLGASGTAAGNLPYEAAHRLSLDWFGTTRARLGAAIADRMLVYVTGGLAYGRVTTATRFEVPGGSYAGSGRDLRIGWTAGAGVEYALTDRLTAKAEYLYYDLGSTTLVGFSALPIPPQVHTRMGVNGHLVRLGLNYRLDWRGPGGVGALLPAGLPASDFAVESGLRYWYSTASTTYDLYGQSRNERVSRLGYSGLSTHAAETFLRVDHQPTGLFFKGFTGMGAVGSGKMIDEDFPPDTVPYSATRSEQRGGSINYVSADLGYTFATGARYRIGGFVGYHYLNERLNSFGCMSFASNLCVPATSGAMLVISDQANWNSLRLGLTADYMLTDQLKLTAEAAWLPYSQVQGKDSHWLRIGTAFNGPTPITGTGHSGVQLEAILSYQVTPALSLGVGARYWRMAMGGTARTDVSMPGQLPQVLDLKTERYGGFLQAGVKF